MRFIAHPGGMTDQHHHDGVPSGRLHALGHRIRHAIRPHSHDHRTDTALEASAEGWRTLWISLAALAVTAGAQAAVVALSGSVALLGDTLHNAADALTAVPIGVAFLLGRRRPTRRYTYGYGRAEDLAGIAIVVVISISCAVAAWAAVQRLADPRPVTHLAAVAVAAVLGFAGNELVARYRITTGRRIGSAALVADGRHARAVPRSKQPRTPPRPRSSARPSPVPPGDALHLSSWFFFYRTDRGARPPALPTTCRSEAVAGVDVLQ